MEPHTETLQRTDAASRHMKASPEKIYQAMTLQSAFSKWKAPEGMYIEMYHFNPMIGGTYRFALYYNNRKIKGKAGNNSDIVTGRFIDLQPGRKIMEAVRFESPDPAFAGEMLITTDITPEKGSTLVTITATQVPAGITHEDHVAGIESSLANLAAFVE